MWIFLIFEPGTEPRPLHKRGHRFTRPTSFHQICQRTTRWGFQDRLSRYSSSNLVVRMNANSYANGPEESNSRTCWSSAKLNLANKTFSPWIRFLNPILLANMMIYLRPPNILFVICSHPTWNSDTDTRFFDPKDIYEESMEWDQKFSIKSTIKR